MTEKIQAITGMNDILGDEAKLWQKLERVSRGILSDYGYDEIRTPILEATGLFARGIGEGTQVVQKEMYTFEDKGGDSVTMRPEGTAGVVRAYVEHALQAQEEITKLYYMGPMFRYERPQKGRLRQFHQIGCEVFGLDSPIADAETVIIVDRIAKGVGVTDFELFINTLGTTEEREPYLAKLVGHFEGLAGALCPDCQGRLAKNPLRVFDCKNPKCGEIAKEAPLLVDSLGADSRRHFDVFQDSLARANVAFKVNPRIVRGLDYYEKSTFEFVSSRLGSQSAFAGGGRYNKLVEELGGKPSPGVGFGLGCERLVLLMQGLPEEAKTSSGVYFVAFNDAALMKARELLQVARDAGIRAEAGFEAKSFKSQMRRADKGGFKFAAILGDDELTKGAVALKNLTDHSQRDVEFEELVAAVRG
jgi:histidyl-tRNA synthetase